MDTLGEKISKNMKGKMFKICWLGYLMLKYAHFRQDQIDKIDLNIVTRFLPPPPSLLHHGFSTNLKGK